MSKVVCEVHGPTGITLVSPSVFTACRLGALSEVPQEVEMESVFSDSETCYVDRKFAERFSIPNGEVVTFDQLEAIEGTAADFLPEMKPHCAICFADMLRAVRAEG